MLSLEGVSLAQLRLNNSLQLAWAAGFEARPIDGLTISAMYGGALRCSVKVLAR